MTGFNLLTLITKTYEEDELGQRLPVEARRDVFCRMKSVSQSEFFKAGRSGINASYTAALATSFDYDGEEIAEYEGERYAIYRTYKTDTDQMELYLQRETGVR